MDRNQLFPLRVIRFTLVACFAIVSWTPLLAQQAIDQSAQDQKVERLLKRIEELEGRLNSLEVKHQGESETPPPAAAAPGSSPLAAPASPPALSASDQATADAIVQEANSGGVDAHTFGKLQIRGFSDFTFGRPLEENLPGYNGDQTPVSGHVAGDTYSFAVGDLSLFISSQLTQKLSFYSELLITSDFTNAWSAELDRAVLQYKANDYFQIGVGRFNTALGYYTNEIGRAKFFQTATDRPFMYTDEDAGGVLPVHSVGLTMTGKIPTGAVGLHWVAELSNGEASNSFRAGAEPDQNTYDENNRKAYNLGLFVQPEKLAGFKAGLSVYRDILEPAGQPKVRENIIGAYAAYVRPKYEFLNEVAILSHSPAGSPTTYRSWMGYTQVDRRFGHVRPYLRLEYQAVPRFDPLIGGIGVRKDFEAGIRYDFGEYMAIKAQFGRTYLGGTWAIDPQVQLAFTF
jgi:hypothetical protein